MQEFLGEDFETYFIVWQDNRARPPTAEVCERIQAMMPDVTVLYDADATLQSANLDNRHVHFVLEEGAVVRFRQAFSESGFQNAIRDTLAE